MEKQTTYQQIKQFVMGTKTTKPEKQAKLPKPILIKAPSGGFPQNEKDWTGFAKKNKVKLPYFCVEGIDHTRRTSDGKPYITAEQFSADGGEWNQVQGFRLKK